MAPERRKDTSSEAATTPLVKSIALGSAVASLALVALAYAATMVRGTAPTWAAWFMAIGTGCLFGALTVLGAARADRPRRSILRSATLIVLMLLVPFGVALWLPAEQASSPLVLGLPLRAAIVIYGVGIVPALVLPFVYARTFDSLTLSAEDLAAVREAARQARETS